LVKTKYTVLAAEIAKQRCSQHLKDHPMIGKGCMPEFAGQTDSHQRFEDNATLKNSGDNSSVRYLTPAA